MIKINYSELIGKKFSRLTITGLGSPKKRKDGRNHAVLLWKCDCGAIGQSTYTLIKQGHTNSCGCYRLDRIIEKNTKHGKSESPIYKVWAGMITRCCNPNDAAYVNYGKRGIRVCSEWRNDSGAFINWASLNGYKTGLQLDRKNNNAGYSPGNCRFVETKINQRNKRNNKYIYFRNETKSLAEWCELLKIKYSVALRRIYRGWGLDDVFFQPIGTRLL